MRILLLSQFFQPEPMFKGLPFAKALRDRGHEVEVLTGFPNYPGGRVYPGYRVRAFQREEMDGITVHRAPLYPSHDLSSARRMANYLSFAGSAAAYGPWVTRRPDVIYVYNLVTLSAAWRLLRALRGSAVVLDVQDLWPESVFASRMMKNPGAGWFLKHLCRGAYRSADRVTVLSHGFKQHLTRLGVDSSRIDVIHNWCDEHAMTMTEAQADALRQRVGFAGKFNVLFAGTMGKAQALDAVIESARQIEVMAPQVLFTFVGGGVEVSSLQAKAAGLSNVQFLPKCSGREAAELASVADALLVHLRRDPLFSITIPSKTQAYLFAGKPILMGVEGDAAALVREAEAGLCFASEDVTAITEAVLACSKLTPEARRQMGQRGHAYYARELSFSRGVDRFEASFAAAIERVQNVVQ